MWGHRTTPPMSTITATPGPLLTFTLSRRGEEFTFSTMHTLASAAEALAGSRSDFAIDLRLAWRQGRLSPRQAPWMLCLAEEALPTVQTTAPPAPLLPLVEAMYRLQDQADAKAASRNRTASKVVLRLPGKLVVSTVIQGVNRGHLYVRLAGQYVGKVTPAGQLRMAGGMGRWTEQTLQGLQAAQADPTGQAIQYGRETGRCSCCGRQLTNQVSIDLGIGPICLENLGSGWG